MSTDTATRPVPTVSPERWNGAVAVRRTAIAALASLLGAVTLKGLLRDSGWLVDVVLTIFVVTAPAALLRLRRPPGALDVWPGVVLMIPWLTARFVPAHAFGGVIPTRGTLHDVSTLMTNLHHTMNDETAPIHSTTAVRLVLCALIGLLAALVDLIAVVGRRGALAGIPLLIVYTVSGAVPRRAVSWEWFVAAALGFLLLLSLDASDDRASWGHRVADPKGGGGKTVVTRTAPRLAIIAIVIAVVVPLALPVQSTNLVANAFHSGNGLRGFGASQGGGGTISPFAALRDQLNRGKPENVMTVHISGDPRSTPFYLRVNVLDKYGAAGWSVSDHGVTQDIQMSHLDTAPNDDQPPSSRFTAQISVSGLGGNAPIFATLAEVEDVEAGTTWSSQDQLLLGTSVHSNETITETVAQATPSVANLKAAGDDYSALEPAINRWLAKPQLPAYVVNLVQRLTGGASSAYAKARAISDYFANPANNFRYSLQTPVASSNSALVDFLKGRQGFCQQYAAAMAIMLRQAGVPSRVVLGYIHPQPDAAGNFTVTTNDAHAWVEAYFPGLGWIPFDPTPTAGLAGGASSDLVWAPHNYGAKGPDQVAPHESGQQSSAASTPKISAVPTQQPAASSNASSSSGWLPILLTLLIVALAAAVVLLPAMVRAVRRRRRVAAARNGDADALWGELSDTAVDLGYVWSAARSPRQVADWLAPKVDTSRKALISLTGAVERSRYGPAATATEPSDVPGLAEGLRDVSDELRAGVSTRTRFLARFWPRSLGWSVRKH